MSALPEGFTLDQPALPPGFAVDGGTAQTFTYDPHEAALAKLGLGNPNLPPDLAAAGLVPNGGPRPAMSGPPTAFPGVQMGLGDPFVGGAQLGAHLLQPIAPSLAPAMDSVVRQREADYKANYNPGPFDVGRIGGNVLATLPLSVAMPGGPILSGVGGGAASSVLQPTIAKDNADYFTQKAEDAGLGAATGGAGAAGVATVARAVQGAARPAVQTLMNAGVRPTPGQIIGGSANRMEQGLTSVPLIGDAINNARFGTVQQFNRGVINDALAPIGQTLPDNVPLGREAIDHAATAISNNYDTILPRLRPQADATFATNMTNLMAGSRTMLPARATQFQNIIQDTILRRMAPGGGMTGAGFKEADSQLGQYVRQFRNAADPDMRQMGNALLQAQTELRGMVLRSNPTLAPELRANDQAYALFLRAQTAAGRQGAEEGVFTPAQYSSAVRQLDPSLGKRAYARGAAVGQEMSDAGRSVLGNTVPDSGTPFRGMMVALPALAVTATQHPLLAAGIAGGGTAALGAYSPVGRTILAHLLATRPGFAGPLADAIRVGSPLASVTAPAIARGLLAPGP
jgi:hypothetical protein